MKNTFLTILALLLIGGGVILFSQKNTTSVACTTEARICPDGSAVGRTGPNCEFATCPTAQVAADPRNTTYQINGTPVTLVNGHAESTTTPDSASKTITIYFGNEATGDLNGDDKDDIAVILTQTTDGSGTFFYAVVALASGTGYQGTNAVLLGDRIAPQTTEIKNGEALFNYADRKPGEPMTSKPSVGVSRYFTITGTTLKESPRIVGVGERCGGNMTTAPVCKTGYHCAPVPGSHLPFGDVGGTCVAN